MKFSVLMSLYRNEAPAHLHACLASLAAQTLPADDIVLVYDGALPAALEAVVQSFQAALPLQIVRLPHNVGLGRALNQGLPHCRHEWVMRMDTDDICLPQRFAQQCTHIQAHPDLDLLGGQIAEFEQQPQQQQHSRQVPLSHDEICRFARRRNPFNHMAVAYRKVAVAAAGGYHHHLYMEDYNLWLRMLAAGARSANLPHTLVLARTGQAMLLRRRGRVYVASEWQLARLKHRLHFQAALPALYYFALRALPRLLPAGLLGHVYRILRRR